MENHNYVELYWINPFFYSMIQCLRRFDNVQCIIALFSSFVDFSIEFDLKQKELFKKSLKEFRNTLIEKYFHKNNTE